MKYIQQTEIHHPSFLRDENSDQADVLESVQQYVYPQ